MEKKGRKRRRKRRGRRRKKRGKGERRSKRKGEWKYNMYTICMYMNVHSSISKCIHTA